MKKMYLSLTKKEMEKIVVIESLLRGYIDIEEAQKQLWVSERTIYRYKKRYKEQWYRWLTHWLRGQPSNHRWSKMDKIKKYAMKKKYRDFWPTLLAEVLSEELWYEINRETLRKAMIRWWMWVPKKRKVKRKMRVRREKEWMMIQFDGSYHDWLEDGKERCLLVAVDDATGKIKKMKLAKSENFEEVIEFWKEYFEEIWKPESIYLDKHSTYKVNHGEDIFDEERRTRFAIGMWKMGVKVIYANSPEWKWRVERLFRTLQDRLIKKMRIRGIKTEEEAERYFEEYIREHNKKYSVKAVLEWDSHIPLTKEEKEKIIWYFGKEEERKIKRDGTIQYNKKIYQIKRWEVLYNWKIIRVIESIDWKVKLYTWEKELTIEKVYEKI